VINRDQGWTGRVHQSRSKKSISVAGVDAGGYFEAAASPIHGLQATQAVLAYSKEAAVQMYSKEAASGCGVDFQARISTALTMAA